MPWNDLQFWIVTAAALGSVWVLVKPWLRRSEGPACGSCASGAAACAKVSSEDSDGRSSLVVLGR